MVGITETAHRFPPTEPPNNPAASSDNCEKTNTVDVQFSENIAGDEQDTNVQSATRDEKSSGGLSYEIDNTGKDGGEESKETKSETQEGGEGGGHAAEAEKEGGGEENKVTVEADVHAACAATTSTDPHNTDTGSQHHSHHGVSVITKFVLYIIFLHLFNMNACLFSGCM